VEPDARRVRAAEVVGAVSLATDLGTGQPLEHTLRTAILAVRLGDVAGASPQELRDAYYVSLLHAFGCTSDAPEQPRRSCCARPRRSASARRPSTPCWPRPGIGWSTARASCPPA
jgi:hypothetical protein